MFFLLLGLLNATSNNHHVDIKILTEDRNYELTLTPDAVYKEKIMFRPTTLYNLRDNVFTYDTKRGGIKTMYNEYLTKEPHLYSGGHYIKPSLTQNSVDDWRIRGLTQYNTIKNSHHHCFKRGKYLKELDAYELKVGLCSVSDKAQRFIVVAIPRRHHGDICRLLNKKNTSCTDDYPLTETDVKERPMLII